MTAISAERYREIRKIAAKLLLYCGASALPVNPFWVQEHFGHIRAMSYQEFADKYYHGNRQAMREDYGDTDGCTIRNHRPYGFILLYNTEAPGQPNKGRLNWTIAHELGHIFLRHHLISQYTPIMKGGLSQEEYAYEEGEADYFAAMLLAYPAIIAACKITGVKDLMDTCQISRQAAAIRLKSASVSSMARSDFDDAVVRRFRGFLNDRYCDACDIITESSHAKFCPTCGKKLLRYNEDKHGDLFTQIKKITAIDTEKGFAKCTGCKAELAAYDSENRTIDDAAYCHHCGKEIAEDVKKRYRPRAAFLGIVDREAMDELFAAMDAE